MAATSKRAKCGVCRKFIAVRIDGQFRVHTSCGERCPGSEQTPATYWDTARGATIDPYMGMEVKTQQPVRPERDDVTNFADEPASFWPYRALMARVVTECGRTFTITVQANGTVMTANRPIAYLQMEAARHIAVKGYAAMSTFTVWGIC